MSTRFCKKCGLELLNDHIHDYDYDYDCHTYKCPDCGHIALEEETIVTDYEIGDIVEYKGKEYTITDIYINDIFEIMVELNGGYIYTDTFSIN
jgi:hypothetical protein